MVSWSWILLALFGSFVLGIIVRGVLSFGREEDAYRDGFGKGYQEGFEKGYRKGFEDRDRDQGPEVKGQGSGKN